MTAPVTIYGIKSCDTMKKARAWLDSRGVAYRFHDYRVQGVERQLLETWVAQAGWETLLNRAGTTFRKLSDENKSELNRDKAIDLMLVHSAMIKRPVLTAGSTLIVGFSAERYAARLASLGAKSSGAV
jgi:arsenate reductase